MIDLNCIRENIKKIPRLNLVNLPTPLEKLDNLSKKLKGPNIYMKRDDVIGGNKMRKLEFLAADAVAKNKKKIVTFGAVGSNHTREVAVVSNKLGLKPIIFITGDKKNIKKQGNFLLNTILGAEIKILKPLENAPFAKNGLDTVEKLSKALIEKIPEKYKKK